MRPHLSLALALAAGLALAAPAAAQEAAAGTAPEAAAEAEPALPAIRVARVESAVLRERVIATGLIGAAERIIVQPRIEGQAIDELLADVGDTVAAGQVLARLSGTALELQKSQLVASRAAAEAALAQADAQLIEARASADEAIQARERAVRLREQGVSSEAAREQAVAAATSALARVTVAEQGRASAEAQLALNDAQMADVELNLSRTEVKAPVGGIVTQRNAVIGAIASAAGAPMFEIIRDGLLELRAEVTEQSILRLAPGQRAELRAVGIAEPLTGTVRLVEPTIDPATRLGIVRIAIDDPARVREGLFAEGEILIEERDAPAVPVTALSAGAGGQTVLVVDDAGVVSRRTVETGIRDGNLVEIRSGLAAGDVLVARAGAFVRDGDRINPVPADTPVAQSN